METSLPENKPVPRRKPGRPPNKRPGVPTYVDIAVAMEEAMIDIWAKYDGKPNVRLMGSGVQYFDRNLGRLAKVMIQEYGKRTRSASE